MPLAPGTRLGVYEIRSSLGAGGMGEVYRAHDPRLGREVALKILPPGVAARPDRLARFEREARAVAALSHPNIVTIHSIEEADGLRFLTMELVEGESLDRLLARGPLSVERVFAIALPLSEALVAAHGKGIVHRDLKPGNVMTTPDGRVKVLDFGLAKLAAPAEDPRPDAATRTAGAPLTMAGQVMGTVPYMAPEQLRGVDVDERADLFAFGVILYELLAGRRPFDGGSSPDLISAILRDEPPPIRAARPDAPALLERIVGRCLEKEPGARFPSASELRDELRLAAREPSRSPAARAASSAGVPAPGGRLPARWLVPAGLVLAAGIAFIGTRAWIAARPPSGPSARVASASIAVLPFADLSPNRDQEYFAEGISEELLGVLAKLEGVHVAARTSAFSFKGKEVQIPEVGRQLHVEHVLEGSVRLAGDRYRITAQLVKASDGFRVWSQTYDLALNDVFSVQDSIARAVVRELRVALRGPRGAGSAPAGIASEVATAAAGRGTNAEAYRLYLQGDFFYDRFNEPDMAKAIDLLSRAVELDPENALAWAGLSRAHMAQASWGWAPSAEEGFARARAAAERSLHLQPNLPEGHVALGWVSLWHDWHWAVAERSYRRALALAPGNADVLHAAAGGLSALGKLDEAMALDRRAVELDPLSVSALRNQGAHFYQAGRLEDAAAALTHAMELGPENGFLPYGLGLVRLAQKRPAEACSLFERVPVPYFRLHGLALGRHAEGDGARSEAALRELVAGHGKDALVQIASAYAFRGDAERAFEWLERARAARDPGLAEIRVEPLFRSLHRDPRWAALLDRMGLGD
jgi:serine/threonine-protein kinase